MVLRDIPQLVWVVVNHHGAIVFANPAALAAPGYDRAEELRGLPSHETVHYKRPDGSVPPAAECPMLRPQQTGETVHSDDDWFVRRDGSLMPIAWWWAPFDMPGGRGAVLAFTDTSVRRAAELAVRERDAAQIRAAESRAAQRRIVESVVAARRQLARNLHDGAQQQLVNLLIEMRQAREEIALDPSRADELLGAATERAQGAIDDLRELIAGDPSLAPHRSRSAPRGRGTRGTCGTTGSPAGLGRPGSSRWDRGECLRKYHCSHELRQGELRSSHGRVWREVHVLSSIVRPSLEGAGWPPRETFELAQ